MKLQLPSFAHLMGAGAVKPAATAGGKRADEDDPRKRLDDETDDEYEQRMKDLDDAAKKSKKSKAESDKDDKDDDEDNDDKKAARGRERERCAAIFADAAAATNPALAATLAFGTDMPRSAAITVLKAGALSAPVAPAAPVAAAPVAEPKVEPANSLDRRMREAAAAIPSVGAGGGEGGGAPNALQALIARAAALHRASKGLKPEA